MTGMRREMSLFSSEELRKKKHDEVNSMLKAIGLYITMLSDENFPRAFYFNQFKQFMSAFLFHIFMFLDREKDASKISLAVMTF